MDPSSSTSNVLSPCSPCARRYAIYRYRPRCPRRTPVERHSLRPHTKRYATDDAHRRRLLYHRYRNSMVRPGLRALICFAQPRPARHVPHLNRICEHAERVLNYPVLISLSPSTQYTPSNSSRSQCTRFVFRPILPAPFPDVRRAVLACLCWRIDLCNYSFD